MSKAGSFLEAIDLELGRQGFRPSTPGQAGARVPSKFKSDWEKLASHLPEDLLLRDTTHYFEVAFEGSEEERSVLSRLGLSRAIQFGGTTGVLPHVLISFPK